MSEITLNNQLSGAEIIEAILDKMRQKLRSDCHLNPNSAYDWFDARIKIELDMHDTGAHIKKDYEVGAASGTVPDGEVDGVSEELHIPAAPPNEVRVSTGQGVPTLTKDAQGNKVVENVRYARKTARAVTGVAVMLLCMAGMGLGQAKAVPDPLHKATAPAAPPVPQTLTTTETVAIQAIVDKHNEAQKNAQDTLEVLRQIESDVARAHPGYYWNEKTGSLTKTPEPHPAK